MKMKMKRKRALSIMLTAVLLVLTVVAAVPSTSAVSADVAQTAAYAIANPAFNVEAGAQGVLVTWNADSRVDHYRVYHKTASGWTKIADNIKVGYYHDTSVVKGSSYTFTVRGLDKSGNFVTDYNRDGGTIAFAPKANLYLLGDTDTDGTVTVLDATNVQRKLVELKISGCKYIDRLGDFDNDGLTVTDATWIQRYIAQISTPYPVGGKLLNVAGTGGNQDPTEAQTTVVNVPKNVNVTLVSEGTKVYDRVTYFNLRSNLNNMSYQCSEYDVLDPHPATDKALKNEAYIASEKIEYLDNGKVRIYLTPNSPDKITWLKAWVSGDSHESGLIDIPMSALVDGYFDYQMPEIESERVNPVVKVTWDKSSNADGYTVVVKDAKGNAVSAPVKVGSGATSANVTLTDMSAGSYTAVVTATKGTSTKSASKAFTVKSTFMADTEERVIKSPITRRTERCVCNKCGMIVEGTVRDHILSDEAYHVMMTEEPIIYDSAVSGAGWNGHDYFNNGGATFPVKWYYWENAPLFFHNNTDGAAYPINAVFTSDPIPTLASTGTLPDGTIGDFDRPNPNPERTCTLDWNFGADKGCLFTLDQLKELMTTEKFTKSNYQKLTLDGLLDQKFAGFHSSVQRCNSTGSYHFSWTNEVCGVNYLYVPATGHIEYTLG